jgi:hypothetical protein
MDGWTDTVLIIYTHTHTHTRTSCKERTQVRIISATVSTDPLLHVTALQEQSLFTISLTIRAINLEISGSTAC